jgi:hypothetical protein
MPASRWGKGFGRATEQSAGIVAEHVIYRPVDQGEHALVISQHRSGGEGSVALAGSVIWRMPGGGAASASSSPPTDT